MSPGSPLVAEHPPPIPPRSPFRTSQCYKQDIGDVWISAHSTSVPGLEGDSAAALYIAIDEVLDTMTSRWPYKMAGKQNRIPIAIKPQRWLSAYAEGNVDSSTSSVYSCYPEDLDKTSETPPQREEEAFYAESSDPSSPRTSCERSGSFSSAATSGKSSDELSSFPSPPGVQVQDFRSKNPINSEDVSVASMICPIEELPAIIYQPRIVASINEDTDDEMMFPPHPAVRLPSSRKEAIRATTRPGRSFSLGAVLTLQKRRSSIRSSRRHTVP